MKAGWWVVPLGEVCTITKKQGGSRPLPYVGLEDIASGGAGLFLGSLDPQTDKSTTFEFEPKHVLYGRLRPYLNKVLLPDFVGHCSSEIFPLLPLPQLDRRFLFHWLTNQQTVDAINATCTGARMPRANVSELMTFPIPLPPLDEQKRIVAVLDEAFEGLSRARANAEANLADARELFESYLAREFLDPPPDWKKATLGSLCRQMTVGHVGPMADRYTDTGIPFLRSQNIKPFRINLTDVKFIGPEFMSELKKSELRPGDVAIVRTGYPGTCAVIPDEIELANCADLVIARTGPSLDPHFMALLLNSRYGKEHVAKVSVGAAQKHFNVGAAKVAVFPIPPIAVQRELVEMATLVRDQGEAVEETTLRKEALIDSLRQSLLQKAFAGALT